MQDLASVSIKQNPEKENKMEQPHIQVRNTGTTITIGIHKEIVESFFKDSGYRASIRFKGSEVSLYPDSKGNKITRGSAKMNYLSLKSTFNPNWPIHERVVKYFDEFTAYNPFKIVISEKFILRHNYAKQFSNRKPVAKEIAQEKGELVVVVAGTEFKFKIPVAELAKLAIELTKKGFSE